MMTTTSVLVVILGSRPTATADETLAGVPRGAEVLVLVPGRHPTPEQHRFVHRAMALSWDRGFVLTAELVIDRRSLQGSLVGQEVRVLAGRRERRRLGLPALA